MLKAIRFEREHRRAELPVEFIRRLDELHSSLTWASIEDLFFHINENTWQLSEAFGIHPARIVGYRKVYCEDRCVPFYEVSEYLIRRRLEAVTVPCAHCKAENEIDERRHEPHFKCIACQKANAVIRLHYIEPGLFDQGNRKVQKHLVTRRLDW